MKSQNKREVINGIYVAKYMDCGKWVVTSKDGNAWCFIGKERVREIFKGLEIF